MSIFNRKRKKRSDSTYWLINDDIAYSKMIPAGYTRLDEIPQIVAGCRKIAELIGSMTIYLMANTEHGDVRITNELSRKIDINPCSVMNRSQFMEYIVMSMLLYGDGNAIVRVKTENGLLNDFQPIPADRFSFLPDQTGYKYKIVIDGVPYDPDEVLHFVYNPDKHYPWKGMGVRIPLNTIAKTVKQAQATKQAFMESKWMPSVIIKADAVADQFATPEGRHRLIEEYITTNKAGEPWVIPADQIDVTAVKPLSLKDIALADSMTQDTVHTELTSAELCRCGETLTTRITCVASVNLVGLLLASEISLLGIDDDHIVAAINMRGKCGLVLTANQLRYLRSETAHYLVGSINNHPLLLCCFLVNGNSLVT